MGSAVVAIGNTNLEVQVGSFIQQNFKVSLTGDSKIAKITPFGKIVELGIELLAFGEFMFIT